MLVVCAGNTCRSPAAAASITLAAERRGITIDVDSAGTTPSPGAPVTETMRRLATNKGMAISGRSRQVDEEDLARADVVLALDRTIQKHLKSMWREPAPVIVLLGGYAFSDSDAEIADPWGGSTSDYARVLEKIIVAADAFVASLID